MAISGPHYRCLKELRNRGDLPQGGSILEIGEGNWYGDMTIKVLVDDIRQMKRPELLTPLYSACDRQDAFDVVKVIYDLFFKTPADSVKAIDFHGKDGAWKHDLNFPVRGKVSFNTIINHGTAEHIFNIGQVFRTMHELCVVGGLMIHESPFTGWIDHGFWTIQPTAYYDLANTNHYDVRYMAVTHIAKGSVIEITSREQLLRLAESDDIPNNACLFVALRKEVECDFRYPIQGYYADAISTEAKKAWTSLR